MSLQHRSGIIPRSHSAEGRVTESEPGQAQAIGSLFKNRRPAVRMRRQGDRWRPDFGSRWKVGVQRWDMLCQAATVWCWCRPVQKHKRTQDWRAVPFRSSSTRGELQIWGVSEAMVGDSGSPYAQGKHRPATGMPRSRAKAWIQAWGKMDIKEARAAPGPERARAATPR